MVHTLDSSDVNINNKVALVTGANKGIGLEIARQLGQSGLTVLVGARDASRGEAAARTLRDEGIDARLLALDVTDQRSIEAAVQTIEAELGRLDILVNNAGVWLEVEGASEANIEAVRRTFDTNFFGVIAVTQALLPLLRKSEAGRIVNLSSGLGSLTKMSDPAYPFYPVNPFAYNASKTALNAFTVSLAKELRQTPIKVNSANPGYTATDMTGHNGLQTASEGARAAVTLALLPDDGPSGGFFDDQGPLAW
jgi:NAD(P)-dependent dehydrogenase (short-subunit alcohol dehydrogenase family)